MIQQTLQPISDIRSIGMQLIQSDFDQLLIGKQQLSRDGQHILETITKWGLGNLLL